MDYNYAWGSNSQVLNNAVVIVTAYDLTGNGGYLDGVYRTMNYILGRNGLSQSYVTGYGERHSRNQHHRHWATSSTRRCPIHPPARWPAGRTRPSRTRRRSST